MEENKVDLTKHYKVMAETATALMLENDVNINKEIARAVSDCIEINELNGKERIPTVDITMKFTLNINSPEVIDIVPKVAWGHRNKKEVTGDRVRVDNTPKMI